MTGFDEDALIAAVELVGRAGATGFQVGYLHDDVPAEEAGWYAHAQYRGHRVTVEDRKSPTEAAEALALEILTGAKCTHCGGLVALSDRGAMFRSTGGWVELADGSLWTEEQARALPQCRWTRMGATWKRGCESDGPPDRRPRAVRRQEELARRRRQRKTR